MHFEVLVEDKSGEKVLEFIMEKILGANNTQHSWTIHSYKGIGRLPKKSSGVTAPEARILLDQLPRILQGYGNSLNNLTAVVVVVDLDSRDCAEFKQELLDLLNQCNPRPNTLFRISIEEIEAWLLGDRAAVKMAYRTAKNKILDTYVQDSICGTWEILADAVYSGGSRKLKKLGYPEIGNAKCQWAERITPHMDVNANCSKSFQVFRNGLKKLVGID